MSRIRSPTAFAAAIVFLSSATALGALLIHDGEVGTDEARLDYLQPGDEARMKGQLVPFFTPLDPAWDSVRDVLSNHTYMFVLEGTEHWILVTNLAPTPPTTVVVEGPVIWEGIHPNLPRELTVLRAERVVEPILFG